MSITFYGKWSLKVLSTSAFFMERAHIRGSNASDGVILGVAGQGIAEIDGTAWTVDMEWSSDGGANWHPSRMRRLPLIAPGEGLYITLGADDNTPEAGDNDYNDLVIHLVYLNRKVNPLGPDEPPYHFTLPPGSFWPPREPGGGGGSTDQSCCCCCGSGGKRSRLTRGCGRR